MKKYKLLVLSIFTIGYVCAQDFNKIPTIRKGAIYGALAVDFNYTQNSIIGTENRLPNSNKFTNDISIFQIKTIPEIGCFFTNNLSVGVGLGYEKSLGINEYYTASNNIQTEKKNDGNGLVIRLLPTYYKAIIDDKLFIIVNLPYTFSTSKINEYQLDNLSVWNQTDYSKIISNTVSINAGFSYFISNKISADITLNFLSVNFLKTESSYPYNRNASRTNIAFYNPSSMLLTFKYFIK
jgi:hypothetical protein